VTSLVIQHCAQVKLHAENESLRLQAERSAQLRAENNRLSNLVVQEKSALSDDQFRELLKLRGEVAMLRKQTNAIQKLREENRQLHARPTTALNQQTQMSPTELNAALSVEAFEALQNICRELQPAMQEFANDHTNQSPRDFSQLRNYFPASGGIRMIGLYSFEFVSETGPMGAPANALILREVGLHRKPDGKWGRFYSSGDGRIVEATPNDEDFDAWEKQHTTLQGTGEQH